MRIYLDVCCLNRPFDDQRDPRVHMEAEAVTMILQRIDAGQWILVSSQIAEIEIAAIPDRERRRRVRALLPASKDRIRLSKAMFVRARGLTDLGFKPADALHVAAAETTRADILLTCDDRVCRLARRYGKKLTIPVMNPLQWVQER